MSSLGRETSTKFPGLAESESEEKAVYENTNGVPLCNGKNLHMDVDKNDIANRIITVGSVSRAELISKLLDPSPSPTRVESSRGFTTITGNYKNVRVSIVAIGMGPSMMDFFVRETRAVTEGPLYIIRFGTCGGLTENPPGTIVVASEGSGYVTRNPDYFHHLYGATNEADNSDDKMPSKPSPYNMSKIAPADEKLSSSLFAELTRTIKDDLVTSGANVTAESFYSSQGRIDDSFHDDNSDIIKSILQNYPKALTMEMETFVLLHLSKCCKLPIYSTAAAIVVANRTTANVIAGSKLVHLEEKGGLAMLETLASTAE